MKKFGIRQIVAALTLLPLLVVVVSMEFFFLRARFSDIDNDLLQRGKLITQQLASVSEYGVFSNNKPFLQDIARNALQQDDVRSVVIQNANFETLVDIGGSPEINHATKSSPNQSEAVEHTLHEKREDRLSSVKAGKESLSIYQPIIPAQVILDDMDTPTNAPQLGAVIIEMSRANTEHRKSQILWFTVLITVVILLFPLYAIYLASRGITRPIRKLSDAVLQIAKGNLDTRVSISSKVNELASLSNGINEMAVQLQEERTILQQRVDEATQALRIKKEAAERASHDKSHFLAVASHDLRQPLHALGLYVAELQRMVSDAKEQHLVGQIEQSIESLSTLLNALLDISKLDAGVVVPQVQTCDANALLNRISSDYQMLARIKNIRLVVHACPEYVISDPLLLERILMNLVSNAIRYTGQNGCVLVACRRRGRFLRFEIRDNGVGIAKTDQEDVFREFFQLSQPHLDTHKGLGLGLAIVERLVNLLGHRIELRSSPGKGSVFALEVAIAKTSNATGKITAIGSLFDAGPEIVKNPLAGRRILIVDDDQMVLSSTASVLTSWGCIVGMADSLAQVEPLLSNQQSWDLLISDYQLGNNTSGFDVIAMVCQHQSRIPCILISGDTSPKILKLASVGGYHLLHKPVRPAKLRSLVTHLLQGI